MRFPRLLLLSSLVLAACPPASKETMAISPATLTLQAGETRTVNAQVTSGDTWVAATGATWTSSDATVLTVSSTGDGSAALQALKAGTATVTAAVRSVSATMTVTVTAAAVTLTRIELTPATPSLARGTTLQLTATGVFSDGTNSDLTSTATWSSADQTVLTVAGGLVTGVTAGTSVVTATRDGKSATLSVTVTAATLSSIAVTPALPSLAKGTTQQLTATGTFSDGTTQDLTTQVSWMSAAATVATVDATGLLTAVGVGTSLVSVSLGDLGGSTTVTVTAAVLTAIDLTPATPTLALGTTQQLTATGRFSDATTQDVTSQATWSSSAIAVATVDNAGLVTSVTVGSSTISAAVGGVTGTVLVTVSAAQLVSLQVTPANPSVARGLTRTFTATGVYTDATTQDLTTQVTWSSGTPAVASISNATGSEGRASAQAVGSSTITATLGTISGSTTLTVTAATLVTLQVTPTTPSVPRGLTQQFTATGVFTDASTQDLTTTVTWATGTTTVATISNATGSRGLLTAVAVGSSTVTATSGTVVGSTNLTVTAATLSRIDVTPVTPSLAKGRTLQLTATGVYSDASTQNLTTQVTWSSSQANFASISNAAGSEGLLTAANVGQSTITATLNSVSGTQVVTVTAAALTAIDVTPALPSVAKGLTQQFTATGRYSDTTTQDLTAQVTWTTGTPATATVSNAAGTEGLASTVAAGSTTVIATLGTVTGNTTLTVTAARLVSIAVSGAPATLPRGRTANLIATGTYTDASTQVITTQVTWVSTPVATATISNVAGSEGLLTAVAPGTASITATQGTIVGQLSVDVTAAVLESIAITPAAPSIAKGRTRQLTAIGTFSDATTQDLTASVTWGSSAPAFLTVSNAAGSHGLASALDLGDGDITAQSGTVTGTTTFTVTPAVLESIAVTPADPTVAKGLTRQFTATGTFSDTTTQDLTATVTWTSGTPAVATISNAAGSHGLATSATVGSSIITATSGAISGNTTLTVSAAALVSIAVTPAAPTLALGGTQQFTAIGTYTDSTTQTLTTQVTWASSDPAALTISNLAGSEGLATTVAAGTSTVSATSGSISGSTLVTVTNASLVSIAVTPANAILPKGRTGQFTAIGTYSDTTTQDLTTQVTWSTADATVATISNVAGSQGLATAVALGSTTVSATFGTVVGSTSFGVSAAVVESIAVTPANSSLAKGLTRQLVATGTYSDSSTADVTTQAIWSSSDPGFATVSTAAGSEGLATAVALGSSTIQATIGAVTGSTTLTVTPAVLVSIAITGAPATIAKGRTAQLAATGTYSDASTQTLTAQVTWAATPSTVATVSNTAGTEGRLTAVGIGTATLTATSGTVVGTTSIDVTAAELVSMVITPTPASIYVGGTLQLTATGTYTDATTQNVTASATWNSQAPAFATVNATTGLVTGVAQGSALIDASIGSVTASISVTVPAQPTVTATSPASAALNVSALTNLSVTFSVAMTPASLTTQAVAGACTGSVQVSTDDFATCIGLGTPSMNGANTIATITPAPALALGTGHKVRVTTSASSATAGNLAAAFTLAAPFTTAVDPRCGTGLVISQVYGGGGNTSAQYLNDFIELHNPTTSPVNITGMAVQFVSASGAGTWAVQALPAGSIPPGGHYLIQEAAGTVLPAPPPLPTPDFIPPTASLFAIGASSGKVALTTNATPLTGANPASAAIVDLVGFGATATAFEGAGPAAAPSNTTSVQRKRAGGVDENSNVTDFVVAAPVPRNSAVINQLVCTRTVNETNDPAEADFCNLQFPASTSATTGTLVEFFYGRIFEAGTTEAGGAAANVRSEFGYGPVGTNPENQSGWTWVPASFNVQVGNDDEYRVQLTAPAVGAYRYTARFSLDGLNWTLCDLNGAGSNAGLSFDPAQLGSLTVTP